MHQSKRNTGSVLWFMERLLDLSVTVVNWNSLALLEQCLRSLYKTLGDCLTGRVSVVDHNRSESSKFRNSCND